MSGREWGHYCYHECPLSLGGRITDMPGDSLHPTMPGTGGHTGRSTWHVKKKRRYVQLSTYDKNIIVPTTTYLWNNKRSISSYQMDFGCYRI